MRNAGYNGSLRVRRDGRWRATAIIAIWSMLGFNGTVAAQEGQYQPQVPTSELGRENFGEAAASATEIKSIILKDPGMMVELKRWLAKDATDHGQIIDAGDLTDDAILQRLDEDVQFRSTATLMLQKYGYLVPKLNPDSPAAKEQELLIQERVKWITQEEEQARAQQQQQVDEQLKKARAGSCDLASNSGCAPTPTQLQGPNPQQGQPNLPYGYPQSPNQQYQPNYPLPNNPLERAQLIPQEEYANDFGGESLGALDNVSLLGGSGAELGLGGNTASLLQQSQDGAGIGGLGSGSGFGSAFSSLGGSDLESSLLGAGVNGLNAGLDSDFGETGLSAYGLAGLDSNYAGYSTSGYEMAPPRSAMIPSLGRQPDYGWSSPYSQYGQSGAYGRRQQTSWLRPVAMVRQPNPYEEIPSLYDMYLQAVPHPANPQRFGMEIFENGEPNPRLIPMDLPVGPDYVIGPGDSLNVDLWGSVSRRITRVVDREGRLTLPEAGPVLVSGKSMAEAQQLIQQQLRTQFRDVSADVSLSRLRTIRVYDVGDVQNPGAYDISSLSTPLNALFAAGGPTSGGSLRIVEQYRGNQLVQVVDLYDLLLHGVKNDLKRLEDGDSVRVPPIGPQVTIEGMVRRPAIYELKDEKNLANVIELAGGLLPTATLRHIEVQRLVAHQKETMLSLDIPTDASNSDVTKQLESFAVQDGDKIRIYPIAAYNEDAVYLEGHVVRPGRYSYKQGMRVTDLLASFKDVLPEPALQYAEIIRLSAPDFHPTVTSFDLEQALSDPSKSPVLEPMDTVQVFSKYDFQDPPSVSVWGDVRQPGTYRTSGQVHLADAVHLAGGLDPDAERTDAQVFRYLPDGQMKIFSVSLKEALAGDSAANIELQPRDRVLIHKNADQVEPATISVEGDVANPGRYPLTNNMTVADLIQVGGGLKPSADDQQADLTRYEWSAQGQVTGTHENVSISAAMSGDPNANMSLHNGDVLTIREKPGWNDLGASITVKGEVRHPGGYGIKPGERLSSILQRAGGFQPDAYVYGAVLERTDVRTVETTSRDEMILRVKDAQSNLELLPDTTPQQKQAKEAALQQWQTTLEQLSNNPPVGRIAIHISSNINLWRNTPNDVEVRAGDVVIIPKKPSYVMVTGQVFNPTAVAYRPGKTAKWYLGESGGPTQMANRKEIFVVRADGSVVGMKDNLWSGSALSTTLQPGDTVVVPEKALSGGVPWQNLFLSAQVASSVVSALIIAVHY